MSKHDGILWSIFWNGARLGGWYSPEVGKILQVFRADIDILNHRIDLL